MKQNLTVDLKKLANTQVIAPLTKHLNNYEKRARELVKELDTRSREARDRSRARLDELVAQFKKTRSELETKVKSLLEEESKRLNQKVNEFLDSLKSNGQRARSAESPAPAKATSQTAEKTASGTKARKKGTGTKRAKKTSSAESERAAGSEETHATTH